MNLTDPIEDVRVLPGDSPQAVPDYKPTDAEQTRASILDYTEEKLREAMTLVTDGLEMFRVVETPRHPNLALLISQQIEQVVEYRRLKS